MKKDLNKYSKWEKRSIKIIDLYLDPENIRLDIENKSQDVIITDLFVNENALQVLESIIENGFFPDELPIVICESKKYTVIEGNRRVASLKVMLNPSLAGKYENRVKKLLEQVKPLENIDVVIAPDRSSVDRLLANKHTKVTRKPWKPLRQAYFYHAQIEKGKNIEDLKKEYPNVDIVKFIKMWEMHKIAKSITYGSDVTTEKVHNQRNFPVSTIERLYDDKNFRDFVGFQFNQNGLIEVNSDQTEFKNIFKQVVSDAVDKVIDTRTLGNESKRKEYFENFKKPKDGKRKTTSSNFKTVSLKSLSSVKNKLDTKGINFQLATYPAVKRMYIELATINIDDGKGFPNATHDLLRSFLECSLKAFFWEHKITINKKGNFAYLNDVLKTFEEDPDVKKIAGDRYVALKGLVGRIRQKEGPGNMREYTANFMNQVNHSHLIFSQKKDVNDGWEILKPLFAFILETIPNENKNKTTT
ncbi:hypothetical protein KJ586_01465 [Patescibacteria group bacterium]|nr:hypothetical protein [Patescibacteria group bacterium]MBU4455163.1 hypothetical protein [Patescibacteria group bacterium]